MAEIFLRLSDKFPIEKPLELDHDYDISTTITVESATKKSDQSGGFDYTFKSKITKEIVLTHLGETFKSKDTKSFSKKMRDYLFVEGIVYEDFMPWYLATELESSIERFKNRHKV